MPRADHRRGPGRDDPSNPDRPPSRDDAARRADTGARAEDGRWRSSTRFRSGPDDDPDEEARDERDQRARAGRDDDAASYRGHAPARQDDRRYLVDQAPDEDRWYGRDLDEELDHGIDRGFSRDADERHDERGLLSDRGGSGRAVRDLRPRLEQRDEAPEREDEEEDRDGLRRDRDWRRDEDERDRSLDRTADPDQAPRGRPAERMSHLADERGRSEHDELRRRVRREEGRHHDAGRGRPRRHD